MTSIANARVSHGGSRTGRLASFVQRAFTDAIASPWDERPIREELFGIERLEEHARSLAAAQTVFAKTLARRRTSRARLAKNDIAARCGLPRRRRRDRQGRRPITPAAEWLIDNFHVVEEQIRDIRPTCRAATIASCRNWPAGRSSACRGSLASAWAFVAHTDSLFDPQTLRRFVRAYQEVQPLTIGELWAVAITLRIVLVENLRRLASRVVASRAGRGQADRLADRLLGARRPCPRAAVRRAGRNSGPPTSPRPSSSSSCRRLRDQGPAIAPALAWIDERLAERGMSSEEVVQDEHQRQVAGSITVRNIITSMRLISDVDWSELVERFSLVDDILVRREPVRRDGFRRPATSTAARSRSWRAAPGRSELDIARAALLAVVAAGHVDTDRVDARHARSRLLSAGERSRRVSRRRSVSVAPLQPWPGRFYRSLGIGGYVSAGGVVAAALSWRPAGVARWPRRGPWLAAALGSWASRRRSTSASRW